MSGMHHRGRSARVSLLLAFLLRAAVPVFAQSDLPPGFTPDPNNPFSDGEKGGHGSNPHLVNPGTSPQPGQPGVNPYQLQPGGGFGAPASGQPLRPPLETEVEGAAINNFQSVNATLAYLDRQVQRHLWITSSTQYGGITQTITYTVHFAPGLSEALVPLMVGFGPDNLQDAIELKPSPRDDDPSVVAIVGQYELGVLESALQPVVASSPSPASTPSPVTPPAAVTETAPWDFNPPLGQTVEGKPIDPAQTPAAVLEYVDHEVRSRMVSKPDDVDFPAGLNTALIPIVARFGLPNLLAAWQQVKAPPPAQGGDITEPRVAGYEREIVLKALKIVAAPGDLPVLIKAAADDKDLFWFIFNKPEWHGDAGLEAFAAQQLDGIDLHHLSESSVVQFAVEDSSPNISGILSERLKSWIVEAGNEDATFKGREVVGDLNRVMGQLVRVPNEAGRKLFPAWATMLVKRYQDDPNPQKSSDELGLIDLVLDFEPSPAAFQDASVRQGVAILTAPVATDTDEGSDYDYLAAGLGNVTAFRELASAYHQVRGVSPTPGNPLQVQVTLNGQPQTNLWFIQEFGPILMKMVTYRCAPGGKADDVFNHLDRATYNNGIWTVTDGSPAAGAVTTAGGGEMPPAPAATPNASSPPGTQAPTPAPGTAPAASTLFAAPANAVSSEPVPTQAH